MRPISSVIEVLEGRGNPVGDGGQAWRDSLHHNKPKLDKTGGERQCRLRLPHRMATNRSNLDATLNLPLSRILRGARAVIDSEDAEAYIGNVPGPSLARRRSRHIGTLSKGSCRARTRSDRNSQGRVTGPRHHPVTYQAFASRLYQLNEDLELLLAVYQNMEADGILPRCSRDPTASRAPESLVNLFTPAVRPKDRLFENIPNGPETEAASNALKAVTRRATCVDGGAGRRYTTTNAVRTEIITTCSYWHAAGYANGHTRRRLFSPGRDFHVQPHAISTRTTSQGEQSPLSSRFLRLLSSCPSDVLTGTRGLGLCVTDVESRTARDRRRRVGVGNSLLASRYDDRRHNIRPHRRL